MKNEDVFYSAGASTGLTNNRAEMLAAIGGIAEHYYRNSELLQKPCRVLIVSDSEWLVNTLLGKYKEGANADLWAQFRFWRDAGYAIQAKHVPRNSTAWHTLADHMAGRSRKLLVALLEESKLVINRLPTLNLPL